MIKTTCMVIMIIPILIICLWECMHDELLKLLNDTNQQT